ncbi:MAG TPA: glycerol kinase GlpK [Thermoanaerobaculia bacterium]|nr:glycerol kinase GlpK [Thermoanaerobaculia bacterium]
MTLILGIDQGTTGTSALLLDARGSVVAFRNVEVACRFPEPGRVEQEPEDLWDSVSRAVTAVLEGRNASRVAAIGLTNQRETSLFWDRATGAPLHRAIVWQDRRTAGRCAELRASGLEPLVTSKTGLLLDPYFSATKAEWMLMNVPGLAARAAAGDALFGTVDAWLASRLAGVHATDVSNASRTLLFDLARLEWDEELCALFSVPRACLPRVVDSAGVLGVTKGCGFLPDGIPIAGIAGDQQAALFGQACFAPGMAKGTYGTGAFVLLHTGGTPVFSRTRLLTTVAWRIAGETTYALEGSAFVAGAAVQWLRDGLGLISSANEIEALAASVPDTGGVVFVPALAGLGAPHWRPEARGLLAGITRGTTRAHVARAVLEAIALQNVDVLQAMAEDAGNIPPSAGCSRSLAGIAELRVDGGASTNDLLMQLQADVLGVRCVRPKVLETTALGAAYLAGLGAGLFASTDELAKRWEEDRVFEPRMPAAEASALRRRYADAVRKA